jgi:hydroxymethylpyrimidine/phosphomethylpyrimidine kinase
LPIALVVTPNVHEAQALTGLTIEGSEDMYRAAEAIHALGPRFVLVKGGHMTTDAAWEGRASDLLFDGQEMLLLVGERVSTPHTHGTGCTFASAIAAGLAKGLSVEESAKEAKVYITEAIRHALPLGHGHGPTHHFATLYTAAGRDYTCATDE